MSVLSLLGFAFSGVHSFQEGATVAALFILGSAGLWLAIDYYRDLLSSRRKSDDDQLP